MTVNRAVLLFLGLLSVAVPCAAWDGEEHYQIGALAYDAACLRARRDVAKLNDGEFQERVLLVCAALPGGHITANYLRTAATYSPLMGEWSALAADHTSEPEELTSIQLGETVVDYRVMTRLATTNYRHFHPAAVTSWRSAHFKSLDAAAAAAKEDGIAQIEAVERALAIQAFAQHYLQDAFAAGHMGFNRVASSNAAALTYHNSASRRGKCVANLNSDVWYTFGDGHLHDSGEAAQRVISAAEESFYDLILAFVTGGTSDRMRWHAIWAMLPAYFRDDVGHAAGCKPGGMWEALRTVSRSAQSVVTFEISVVADSSIYRPAARGVMLGASREFIYTIPIGYRVIRNRIFASAGATTSQLGDRAYVFDWGYVWQVGTSLRGTLTHEIGLGQFAYYAPETERYYAYGSSSVRALYAVNVELGRLYVRLHGGPAYSHGVWGPHVSMALGWVRRSSK